MQLIFQEFGNNFLLIFGKTILFWILISKVWFTLRLRLSLGGVADEGLGASSQQFDLLGGGRDPVQPLTVLLHHRVPAGMEISKYISFVFL